MGILLADPEWGKWSDREIARKVGVGHPLVAAVRASHLEELPDEPDSGKRLVERGGTTYEQDTSNIGKKPPVTVGPSAPAGGKSKPKLPEVGNSTPQEPPSPPAKTEAEQIAEDAHGDADLAQLLDES